MQFGFSTNAFREYPLGEAIDVISDAGFDGVELLLDRPHLYPLDVDDDDLVDVGERLESQGVVASNANAFMLTAIEDFHHPSFIEPDEPYRQRRVEYTVAALDVAAMMGIPHISIEPGGPIPEDKTRDWAVRTFLEGLETVTDHAERVGVDVLVEPEPDLLVETSGQFLELLERVKSDRIGCNFDAGHFFCVEEDPADLVELLAPHTSHYHLEDIPADRAHEHTQLGDGAMDIDAFLQAVEDTGYDGFVTVELYPYEETAAETAREAMDYLRERGWA